MKNKGNFLKNISWTWIAIGILFVALIVFFVRDRQQLSKVCSDDKCFAVEIARTPAEQQKGLMNRDFLDENDGMIFVFPTMGVHNFRMKNTLIPLDMIWIDDQMNVVKILTAEPCIADPCPLYQPGVDAKYVLEINAGMAAEYGIQEGTKMIVKNIE